MYRAFSCKPAIYTWTYPMDMHTSAESKLNGRFIRALSEGIKTIHPGSRSDKYLTTSADSARKIEVYASRSFEEPRVWRANARKSHLRIKNTHYYPTDHKRCSVIANAAHSTERNCRHRLNRWALPFFGVLSTKSDAFTVHAFFFRQNWVWFCACLAVLDLLF